MADKVLAFRGHDAVSALAGLRIENIERPARPALKKQNVFLSRPVAAAVATGIHRRLPLNIAGAIKGTHAKASI